MTTCPACGSTRVADVVWGMPTEEDFRDAPDDVRFGGCMVPVSYFSEECEQCGARWDPSEAPREEDDRA